MRDGFSYYPPVATVAHTRKGATMASNAERLFLSRSTRYAQRIGHTIGFGFDLLDSNALRTNKESRNDITKGLESCAWWCRLWVTIGHGVIADTEENGEIMRRHALRSQSHNATRR